MTNIRYILLIVGFAYLTGCGKTELPPNDIGEVIFKVEATLDGEPLLLEAGKNDVYLYTDYDIDNNGVYNFNGSFRKTTDCTDQCEQALTIKIKDHQPFSSGSLDLNTTFATTNRVYWNNTDSIISIVDDNTILFNVSPSGTAPYTYLWDFGDGNMSTVASPTHTYSDIGTYSVNLITVDATGCYSAVTECLNLSNLEGPKLSNQINVTLLNNNQLLFMPPNGVPGSFVWTATSDSSIFTVVGDSLIFPILPFGSGVVDVCLTLIDSFGCTTSTCASFFTLNGNISAGCHAYFDYEKGNTTAQNVFESQVAIEYVDKNGVKYSTENVEQMSNAKFEIKKMETFDLNENNQKTVKLTVDLDCNLLDEFGNIIHFQGTDVLFAVAYPN